MADGDGGQRCLDVPHVPGRGAGDAWHGGGKIVNISSGTPFRGVPFLLHYVTSKGAIVAFTRALAKEVGKDGVLVNCVAPGFTMSAGVEQHPEVIEKLRDVSVAARTIQRDQVPEDVVGAVVYLSGPGSSFVTGQTIVIDGGQTSIEARARARRGRWPEGTDPLRRHRRRRVRRRCAARRTSAPLSMTPMCWCGSSRTASRREPAPLLAQAVELDPASTGSLRCDRIDFPPGGVAYTHTHPGPASACLLHGELEIGTAGHP